MLDAIKSAIATANLDELEAIEAQLEELAQAISKLQDEAEERRFDLEAEAEEEQARLDAIAEAEAEAEEERRTGKKVWQRELNFDDESYIFVTKYKNLWEICLGNSFYGQVADYDLPINTPEDEVISQAKRNLKNWPYDFRDDVYYPTINGKSHRIHIPATRLREIGITAARAEAEEKIKISCS